MRSTASPPELNARALAAPAHVARRPRRSRLQRALLATEIVVAYARVRRVLRQAPIDVVVQNLRCPSPPGADKSAASAPIVADADARSSAERLIVARGLGNAVTRTLAMLPGDTRCLTQSLVLTRLLSSRGIPSRLVIAARPAPSFFAHAWVEHAGQPLLATGDGLFEKLVEL